MSSSHLVIIARNMKTGQIDLPLGDHMTLYGCGGEEELVRACAGNYTDDWVLTLYHPRGPDVLGWEAQEAGPR